MRVCAKLNAAGESPISARSRVMITIFPAGPCRFSSVRYLLSFRTTLNSNPTNGSWLSERYIQDDIPPGESFEHTYIWTACM
ncbi:hypothetical protein VTN02DRAFT_4048 [Thermoascus thermophilus]